MRTTRVYLGFGLHVLVASVILFSAGIKFFELIGQGDSPEGFQGGVLLLGVAELANALLLLIPRTMSIGILVTSAGWGAVIAGVLLEANPQIAPMHPAVPTAFLVMTWIGGYLRDSRMLYSFNPPKDGGPESRM